MLFSGSVVLPSGKSKAVHAGQMINHCSRRETRKTAPNPINWKGNVMKLNTLIQQAGATGYILLWLLGIPIPILLLIFLLRGCT